MINDFKVQPRWIIHFFLWLGLLAGIAVRSLTILSRINPDIVIWVWRFAMVSYTIFFGYRYKIAHRRRRIVEEYHLQEHVEQMQELDTKTKEAMTYVMRSISRSKELFNYAFIASLSLIALIIDFFVGKS